MLQISMHEATINSFVLLIENGEIGTSNILSGEKYIMKKAIIPAFREKLLIIKY